MIFYLSFLNKITMKIVANNIKCVTVATDRVFFYFLFFGLFFFICATCNTSLHTLRVMAVNNICLNS